MIDRDKQLEEIEKRLDKLEDLIQAQKERDKEKEYFER
jgi:hypothetical protein